MRFKLEYWKMNISVKNKVKNGKGLSDEIIIISMKL